MNETGDILQSVDLLLAAARTGSAQQAARELGTTAATVLRRIAALEAALGARLFDRLPTGLRATPALGLVRPWAEQAEAAAAGMLRQLSGLETRPVGRVRLAVLPATASLFVVPALPRLRESYPDLTLELAPATAVVDLTMREADLAIRTVRPAKGELVAQRLASFRLAVVRAPKLRVRRGAPLADLPWLSWDAGLAHLPEAQWLAANVPGARVVFRATELATLLAAAQQGIGLLVVPSAVAERAGGLEPLEVPASVPTEGAVWLVAHAALRPVARVAAVWDWLVTAFAEATATSRRAPAPVDGTPRNAHDKVGV
ncbi:MAG: LysR family transcriptional regulator [Polyangiaceae bacterium]|nr:LysR family transcriptional regulator [Polyangiaceae bacterium]